LTFVTENVAGDFEKFLEDGDGIPGIGADDESAIALQNLIAQRAAPEVSHGIVNVVGIADAGDEAFGQFSRMLHRRRPRELRPTR